MILVTGASGFLGGALVRYLGSVSQEQLVVAVRQGGHVWPVNVEERLVTDLDGRTDWSEVLEGVTTVVHCAARVHVMKDDAQDPLVEFRRVNLDGTLNLARQAAASGVERFIFISSIKVNGEWTEAGQKFSAHDDPNPQDDYGLSKHEAEFGLKEICSGTGMEFVILRPPLVYGAGVKGNFATMVNVVRRGLLLPLGSCNNRRSLVSVGNLVELIHVCVTHRSAANQVFLVSDGEDVSTAELLTLISITLGKPRRLFPVPLKFLKLGAVVLGRQDIAQRLLGNMQVDISNTREMLDWAPRLTVAEGIKIATLDS